MVKIYIDAGHGGRDSGATGNGLLEKDVTLQIARSIRTQLKKYENVSIKMSRSTDKTVSLTKRTNAANSWGADYFLSIHVNAGGGTGFESYIYDGLSNSSKTAKMRKVIHEKLLQVNELRDRGQKRANLHVLRESKMSAMLTENGFIDTAADAQKMKDKDWIERVAKAHAEGLKEVFKLRKKTQENNNDDETFTLTTSVPGYYTADDAKNGKNKKVTVKAGTYYVYKRSQGMINVTKQKGIPGSWINP